MLKAAFLYILHMNLHKYQLYLNYTANPLKFGQQLLGLTLTVNPWFWNLGFADFYWITIILPMSHMSFFEYLSIQQQIFWLDFSEK